MTHSFYIDRLLRWLRSSRVQVNTADTELPEHVAGRCWNIEQDGFELIAINVCSAREALLTLAHEAGHWLGNTTFGYRKHGYQRERQACVYGWRVIMLIGADAIVTRSQWFQFNVTDLMPNSTGYRSIS